MAEKENKGVEDDEGGLVAEVLLAPLNEKVDGGAFGSVSVVVLKEKVDVGAAGVEVIAPNEKAGGFAGVESLLKKFKLGLGVSTVAEPKLGFVSSFSVLAMVKEGEALTESVFLFSLVDGEFFLDSRSLRCFS